MNYLISSDEVRMWVYEETLPSGEKLTDVINQTNVRIILVSVHPNKGASVFDNASV